MPLFRIDIPEGHTQEQKQVLFDAVHSAVATTWAKEHIWIALREKFSPPGDRQVLITVDLRPGRGHEEQRMRALLETIQPAFAETIGTARRDTIVLVREFPQEACLSGRARLPPLEALTPDLDAS